MTSYPLKEYPIYPIEGAKPHITKPHYGGSNNSHSEHSHGEKDIKYY